MRIARVSKSQAARLLGISRRTVIRYAATKLITEDSHGRVLLSQVRKAWSEPIKKGWPNTIGRKGGRGLRRYRSSRAYWPIIFRGHVTNGRTLSINDPDVKFILESHVEVWREEFGVTAKTKLTQKRNMRILWSGSDKHVDAYQSKSKDLSITPETEAYLAARGIRKIDNLADV